jgi:outer membrane lipoprotein SlyB
MRWNVLNRAVWAVLWLWAAAFGLAHAQAQPLIRAFTVQQVPALTPGTELVFRLSGTAGGQVGVTLRGTDNVVALRETRAGQYEGAYTLSRRDQVKFDSAVLATLKVGERQVQAGLDQTLLSAAAHRAALEAASPAAVVDYFATQADGYAGGDEIVFTVRGSPAGKASVRLAGSDALIELTEQAAGEYSGRYTIRSRDRLTAASQATLRLSTGSRVLELNKALSADALQPTRAARQSCATCGVVQAVQVVDVPAEPGYTGAIAGGVAGAVLGNQIGKGDGRTVASILGAVGGAYAGREIEKRVAKAQRYDVTVRLHNGQVQTVSLAQDPGLKVGAQVKIVDGAVLAND